MSLIKKMGLELQKIYKKIFLKLYSIKGSSKSIAKGFATGVAVSFTPFVGFHILLSLIITKLTKQNSIAATLGTIAGNPWTFPFIWYLTLHTGHFLLSSDAPPLPVDFKVFFKNLFHAVISLDFNLFISDIWPIFLPMLVGCIPYYIIVWWLVSKIIEKSLPSSQYEGENNDTRSRV